MAPGAYIYIADSALVSQANLAAMGATLFISRLPATYGECKRLIQGAVAAPSWHEVGVLARTKPTKNRPGAAYRVWESAVELHGKAYRAIVVHSSAQAGRRQTRLERDVQAAKAALEATVRQATKPTYLCHAEAAQAAKALGRQANAYYDLDIAIEERPRYGPGRPRANQPREVKALHDGLQVNLCERAEVMAQKAQEAGCFVLLTTVPTEGEMAHQAAEVLAAYKEQHGMEQNDGFLKDPPIVNARFLEKPERLEAFGGVLLLALWIWRLIERSLRPHVESTQSKLSGGAHKETERPTAFMMMTKFARVTVVKVGAQRQVVKGFSPAQQHDLMALGLSAACSTQSSG